MMSVRCPPASMAYDRQLGPGRRCHELDHGHAFGLDLAAHPVLVPVREHDDVALLGPMRLTAFERDPAAPARDDMEVEEALPAGAQDAGHQLPGRRLVRPRLRVLAAQEDGALETHVLERRGQRACAARRHLGVPVSFRGVTVMALFSAPRDNSVSHRSRDPTKEVTVMDLYVILRRNGWRTAEDLEQAAARSTAEGEKMPDDIAWIRSYVLAETDGSVGTVCIYQASSPEAVRTHAERCRPPGRRDHQGRRHRARQARSGHGHGLRTESGDFVRGGRRS